MTKELFVCCLRVLYVMYYKYFYYMLLVNEYPAYNTGEVTKYPGNAFIQKDTAN